MNMLQALRLAMPLSLLFASMAMSQDQDWLKEAVARAPMMSWEEYASRDFAKPYIAQVKHRSGGELLYFGAEHSSDPKHAQFVQIQELWKKFSPQVAFVEGRLPSLKEERDQAIRENGEPGMVRYLAESQSVLTRSMDTPVDEQAAFLLKLYPSDQVKLYFVLRQVVRHKRFQDRRSLENETLPSYFESLSKIPGLGGAPANLVELDTTYRQYFPEGGSFRDAIQRWFDPLGKVNWVNEASIRLAEERNRTMVAQIVREVMAGKRVFAVVGRTHAIMQEPAIDSLIETYSAPSANIK